MSKIKWEDMEILRIPRDVAAELDAQRMEVDAGKGRPPERDEFIAFILAARARALQQMSVQRKEDLQ